MKVTPASGEPGTSATVHAVLRNRSTQALTGKLTLSVPSGWTVPAAVDATIAPGAEVGVDSVVAVPVEGNAATVDLTAMFSDARGELISAPAEFAVTQSLTPVGAIDYVDLGDGAATDDPALLSASTVRVRIRHNASASGYDPSIADVWSLPLP